MNESQHQQAIVRHLKVRCAGDATWWAVPNGMFSNPVTASRCKAEGLRPGVPDLCFLKAGKPYFIELKAPKSSHGAKGYCTANQIEMHREIANAGGRVAVCFGHDEAIRQLEEWGVLEGRS